MTYELRTDEGVHIADLSNHAAGEMINNVKGHWAEKNFVTSGKCSVYIIDDGASFNLPNLGIRFMFHANYYLRKAP